VIALEGVCKTYPHPSGPVSALAHVALEIPHGAFVAVTGESGSGKSTLLQILGCLDRPSSGVYRLDGRNVGTFDDAALAQLRNRCFGFVFQTSQFVDYFDLAANVALPAEYGHGEPTRAARERAFRLLAEVGLAHRATHLPRELSGGERQRASVARALFHAPKIVLADEPTGNLDRDNADRLAEMFEALAANGTTVLLVTHDERLAACAALHYRLYKGALERCR
jgi:putative ABC transport system ATP-binding protein